MADDIFRDNHTYQDFEAWLNEQEGYSIRNERIGEDFSEIIKDEYKRRQFYNWMKAAFVAGRSMTGSHITTKDMQRLSPNFDSKQRILPKYLWVVQRTTEYKAVYYGDVPGGKEITGYINRQDVWQSIDGKGGGRKPVLGEVLEVAGEIFVKLVETSTVVGPLTDVK